MLAKSRIHEKAALGFGRSADAYERGRPEYSDEAVRFVADHLREFSSANLEEGVPPRSLSVADLAAGTGKFTRVLSSLEPTIISSITAIEPVAEMRAKITDLAKISVTADGTAENIPFAAASFDVVTVAQAFHWFDAPAALREIHRVLKPGGMLLMIWNVRDETHSWIREMTELMVPYEGSAPRYRTMNWQRAFDADHSSKSPHFSSLEFTKFKHLTVGPKSTMLDRVASVSFVAALSPTDRENLLRQMSELYERHLCEAQITNGEIAMPYETHFFTCRRI